MSCESVIEIRHGFKKFQYSDYVLQDVNMDISKGCIYSLLGPSGCGKTTLLSCIVGLQKLSSGLISMKTIRSPRDIGYMPQEVALQTVCTIEETFYMYGLIFGMSKEDIYRRLKDLTSLLHLPDSNTLVSTLSGGQQRRISFAVALLHNPGTLLLDEPTVGLDPLLRLTIWDYLKQSVKNENQTVIITTHYMEEARNADKVGFMREGKIICEENANVIMHSYRKTCLEDVFVELCKEQVNLQITHEKKAINDNTTRGRSTYNPQDILFSYSRFKSQVYRDYLWTKRNLLLLFGLMILPVSQSILFSLTYGRYPNDLKIGLITEENLSNEICSRRNHLRYFNEGFARMNCSTPVSLSCQYYRSLEDKVDVKLYDNIDIALADSYSNKIWGFVHINSNFTEAVISRLLEGVTASDEDITTSLINVRLDMTNYVISHHIRKKLVKALVDTINYMVEKCQFPASIGSWPIKIVNKFFEGGELVGSGSEAAGFISGFCFYFSLMFTASALFVEKINGATDRYKVTGTTFIEIVTGHLVIQLLLLTLQKTIMLSIIYGGFGYLFNGSVALVYLGLYLIEFVGISLGIFLSVVTDVTFTINLLIIFFTLAMFLLGGVGWPEDAMHWLLHIYKWTVPAQPAMSSLRHVIIRNENLTSPNVYVGYSVCLLWIALITLCTYVVIKIKNR